MTPSLAGARAPGLEPFCASLFSSDTDGSRSWTRDKTFTEEKVNEDAVVWVIESNLKIENNQDRKWEKAVYDEIGVDEVIFYIIRVQS